MKVLSLNLSLPKEVDYKGKKVKTGIFKEPVEGRRKVRKLNIEGDGQADLLAHGGEMRAVYVYSHDNYGFWEKELGRSPMKMGQFGENLTVEGMLDHEVFIGNQYRIGSALFEVTQPRVPCYKLAMKMEQDGFYNKILQSGRLGFYLRVLEEGDIGSGDEIIPIKIEEHQIDIGKVNSLMYFNKEDFEGFREALKVEALSPGWKATFEDRLAKENVSNQENSNYYPLTVSKRIQETPNVVSFYLSSKDSNPLEKYLPGQFLPIKLDIPGQYQSVHRTYTLSDAPSEKEYRLTIKREKAPVDIPDAYPGVSSNYFHDSIQEGSEILAATPRGKFYLNKEKTKPLVLISAGVGITPMISILSAMSQSDTNRTIWFLHGARNGDEHIMKDYVVSQGESLKELNYRFAYSQPSNTDTIGQDYHHHGRIDLAFLKSVVSRDCDFYICGPTGFMKSVITGLDEWGVNPQDINYEFFGPSSGSFVQDMAKKKRGKSVKECCNDVAVTFTKSKIKANWNPSFESILEFAESLGVNPDFSCRSGICQTCTCKMVEGDVEYKQEPLVEPSDGNILICCSVPASDIEIDL